MLRLGDVHCNEMICAINLLNYFDPAINPHIPRPFPRTREQLAAILGTGSKLAQEFLNVRASGERPPSEIRMTSGWKKNIESRFSESVLAFLQEQNDVGDHISLPRIKAHLGKLSPPIDLSFSTIRRNLHEMGVNFGGGNRRHHLYNTPGNIKYRIRYAKRRLQNIARLNVSPSPQVPEVFLDESYCHIGHNSKRTWYRPGDIVLQHGRGPMLVMFGAFIVYNNNGKVQAEIVPKSLDIWPVNGIGHLTPKEEKKSKGNEQTGRQGSNQDSDLDTDEDTYQDMDQETDQERNNGHRLRKRPEQRKNPEQQKTPGKRGRPAKDKELWKIYPDEVLKAHLVPDTRDYHGNFNADIFESLFKQLCKNLRKIYKTGCIIHMDGAKYHMRQEDPPPTKGWKRDDIMAWVGKHNIILPPPLKKEHTVDEVLKHIRSLEWPRVRSSYRIAKRYGHRIMKTPPYHCEVQPIERVWALAKNPIALDPIIKETAVQLRDRLLIQFARITSKQLISVWRKALKACQGYNVADGDDESESEDDANDFVPARGDNESDEPSDEESDEE